GRVRGAQVSLFDVSDLAQPQRIAQLPLGTGSSDAEYDPHAFLWWEPAGLAMLPVNSYEIDSARGFPTSTVRAVHVADGALSEVAAVEHPSVTGEQWSHPITRSLVIGGTLYTLSDAGLGADDIETFERIGFVSL
ncbi:MAG: beta-propeller domain-containing protein, partial [Acidimicrobiales bacterium]